MHYLRLEFGQRLLSVALFPARLIIREPRLAIAKALSFVFGMLACEHLPVLLFLTMSITTQKASGIITTIPGVHHYPPFDMSLHSYRFPSVGFCDAWDTTLVLELGSFAVHTVMPPVRYAFIHTTDTIASDPAFCIFLPLFPADLERLIISRKATVRFCSFWSGRDSSWTFDSLSMLRGCTRLPRLFE